MEKDGDMNSLNTSELYRDIVTIFTEKLNYKKNLDIMGVLSINVDGIEMFVKMNVSIDALNNVVNSNGQRNELKCNNKIWSNLLCAAEKEANGSPSMSNFVTNTNSIVKKVKRKNKNPLKHYSNIVYSEPQEEYVPRVESTKPRESSDNTEKNKFLHLNRKLNCDEAKILFQFDNSFKKNFSQKPKQKYSGDDDSHIAFYFGAGTKICGKLKCKDCDFTSKGIHDFFSHTLNYHHCFTCHQCDNIFTTKNSLLRHRIVHTELRRFACLICKRGFFRRDHCKNHIKTHANSHLIINAESYVSTAEATVISTIEDGVLYYDISFAHKEFPLEIKKPSHDPIKLVIPKANLKSHMNGNLTGNIFNAAILKCNGSMESKLSHGNLINTPPFKKSKLSLNGTMEKINSTTE
ncbi:hypothetical protein A3Q56_02913 [Intoshia linei]|uniref:C2H2-type domain-containing protein n=1 Tax=Intoshia linei TaxID=1819745 RepID=A0A177B6F2_9BILA|nr:hypothetical protein A3Q56_02913 [Intoshia linei]